MHAMELAKETKRSNTYVCNDLVFKMIHRLPPPAVARFRRVSPEWRDYIDEHRLLKPLFKSSGTVGFFYNVHDFPSFQRTDGGGAAAGEDEPSLEFLRGEFSSVKVVNSCNGLLLCRCRREEDECCYCVCKPATKRWERLPGGRDVHYLGLAFDPSVSGHFQALSYYDTPPTATGKKSRRPQKLRTFSSRTQTWEHRWTIRLPDRWSRGHCEVEGAASLGGAIYVLGPRSVLRFPLSGADYDVIEFPPDATDVGVASRSLGRVGNVLWYGVVNRDVVVRIFGIKKPHPTKWIWIHHVQIVFPIAEVPETNVLGFDPEKAKVFYSIANHVFVLDIDDNYSCDSAIGEIEFAVDEKGEFCGYALDVFPYAPRLIDAMEKKSF